VRRLIISAPFGTWARRARDYATPTWGTYTVAKRAGPLKRAWRVLSTVRHWRRAGAWVNRLGLPCPSVYSVGSLPAGTILSVHGFSPLEWEALGWYASRLLPHAVELNLSCPNVRADTLSAGVDAVQLVRRSYTGLLIAKLGPLRPLEWAVRLFHDAQVNHFHLCNTIPGPAGGQSGKYLKPFSLWAVEDVRRVLGRDVVLIGGGGVTGPADVKDYQGAGADHVAVASWLLNPLNWWRLPQLSAAADSILGEPEAVVYNSSGWPLRV
jgi:dihydroorotate dehydrogenase